MCANNRIGRRLNKPRRGRLLSSQRARQHRLVVHWDRLVDLPTPLITRHRVVVTTLTLATRSFWFRDGAEDGILVYVSFERALASTLVCLRQSKSSAHNLPSNQCSSSFIRPVRFRSESSTRRLVVCDNIDELLNGILAMNMKSTKVGEHVDRNVSVDTQA